MMKTLLSLLLFLTFNLFGVERAVNEWTSQEMQENRLTIYYDAFNNSYRMNFFDNDSDIELSDLAHRLAF